MLAILLYGSETWNLTAAEMRRLEAFHNRCLRCMFGISRLTHFTNFDLRKLTGQQSIGAMIMNNRLRWLGHAMRMTDERMTKRMMFARLQTARPQGGTRQRWKDCVLTDLRFMRMEDTWASVATHRDKWHAATKKAVTKWENEKNSKEKEAYTAKKAGVGVPCPRCGKMCKNEAGLKSHFAQIHKGVETSSSSDDDDESHSSTSSSAACRSGSSSSTMGPSKFVCPNCKQDCNSGAGLARHLRCHVECQAKKADGMKKEKGKEKGK